MRYDVSSEEILRRFPRLTAFSAFFMIAAIVTYTWMFTLVNEGVSKIVVVSVMEISLMLTGVSLMSAFELARFEPFTVSRELWKVFYTAFIGLAAILAVQTVLQLPFASIAESEQIENLHLIGAAVAEEFFFRGFLMGYFLKLFTRGYAVDSPAIALAVSLPVSGIFMLFHWIIYGAQFTALAIAFISSIVLCMEYYFSRDLAAPLTTHVLVNLMVAVMT